MRKPASRSRIVMKADFRILEVRIYKGKQADSLDPAEDEQITLSTEDQAEEPLIHIRVKTGILIMLLASGGLGAQLWRLFF